MRPGAIFLRGVSSDRMAMGRRSLARRVIAQATATAVPFAGEVVGDQSFGAAATALAQPSKLVCPRFALWRSTTSRPKRRPVKSVSELIGAPRTVSPIGRRQRRIASDIPLRVKKSLPADGGSAGRSTVGSRRPLRGATVRLTVSSCCGNDWAKATAQLEHSVH